MSDGFVTLLDFSEGELIFDERETKDILGFFFPNSKQKIDAVTITADIRSFAQGLLVEAVDRTYALGYVEILLKTYYNPGMGIKKALSKLGQKSTKHWFKHATQRDLLSAKISSRVRDQLAFNFKTHFEMLLDKIADAPQGRKAHMAYVKYGHASRSDTIWG